MSLTKVTYSMIDGATVNVLDYGAKGDGATNDTPAFQAALTALANGGILYVPKGRYKITDTLLLKTGISVIGESSADRIFGAGPNNSAEASYIFQTTSNKSVFRVEGNTRDITFSRISLGTRLDPNLVPATDIDGIVFSGTYPNSSTAFVIDTVNFYNFRKAILIEDNALPHPPTPDWQCDCVRVDSCVFFMNTTCVYFNADNADDWIFKNCQFLSGDSSQHLHLVRAGYLTILGCFGGKITSGAPVNVYGILVDGDGLFDTTNIISSQWENCTSMISVNTSFYPNRPVGAMKIIMNCSIVESDITIGAPCHYVSIASRYNNNVFVTGSDVICESYSDYFDVLAGVKFIITGSNSKLYNAITSSTTSLGNSNNGWILGGTIQRRDSVIPAGGAFSVGDITWNSSPSAGKPLGWICVVAGSPGTWVPFANLFGSEAAGSPVGVLVPAFVGTEYLDTTAKIWYKSTGLTSADWVALN